MANFNKIKILLLFSSSEIGGAERSLSRMALSNNDDSISYQLTTFGESGKWSEWIFSLNGTPIFFNHSILKLIKYFHTEKPDIVYIIGFRISFLLRIIKVFLPKVRLVQGVRWSPDSNTMLDKTFRFVERLFGFLLDGYIVNSNSARKSLNKLVNNNVELIYNGISYPLERISKSSSNSVITIANLSERKGYKGYLNVISDVVKRVPNSQFLFLGYDNLNGEIQKLIIEKNLDSYVQYLGFQENVENFLTESTIFVLPSQYGEGCPTSILEAFSFKLPVIAYRIDGIPELVSHNDDGILIDVGDSDSFAKAIEDLLLNPIKAAEMGAKGYKKVKENFLLDNMINKHNEYFLKLK